MTGRGGFADDTIATVLPGAATIRVLIADDDEAVRRTLTRLVARSEGLVLAGSATSGAEAISLGLALQPDVALIDVSMPGGDGIKVTEALRAGSPATRVLALSGSAERAEVLGMLAAGASARRPSRPATPSTPRCRYPRERRSRARSRNSASQCMTEPATAPGCCSPAPASFRCGATRSVCSST